jgi:hypothetical protein
MRLSLSVRWVSNAHDAPQKLKPGGVALTNEMCWTKPQDTEQIGGPLHGSYAHDCEDREHGTEEIDFSFDSEGDGNESESVDESANQS